ncbi:hypothetical protein [Dactylosporangium sp. NPDC000521]|uniref:hypothetical protein n=1 Tax=Dactylosporangium sp. NPDC000521 TaxID=3363975 RepID=UPI00369801D8
MKPIASEVVVPQRYWRPLRRVTAGYPNRSRAWRTVSSEMFSPSMVAVIRHVRRFFDDLAMNVNELLVLPNGAVAGYVFGADLDPEARREHQAEGLFGLMTLRLDHTYAQIVWRFAMQIARMFQVQTVEPYVPLTVDGLKDAFS